MWGESGGSLVREYGIGKIPEFRRDGVQPSFLVSGESSDAGILLPKGKGVQVFLLLSVVKGVVDVYLQTEAGVIFLFEGFSACFFRF